jgi:hypothetical protein
MQPPRINVWHKTKRASRTRWPIRHQRRCHLRPSPKKVMILVDDKFPVLRPPGSAPPPNCPDCGNATVIVGTDGQWQCEPCDQWGPMLDSASLDNFDEL